MSDKIAIKVENVSKTFRLPHEKNNSVKGTVLNFYKRKKSYEKQQVLKDISFEIKEGEFFGIVGRNGSGKSTLLKLLAGIYSPSKGKIHINGKLTPFIELGVGFNPELTGRENVFLNGALLGFSRSEMSNMYDEIVEFAELERFMDQKLKNYSSGMQVRLAFSIAIRAKSDILVLDEVLAVGDVLFQEKCFQYFYELKKQKQTVLLVTHDTGIMKKYCERALLIDSGKMVVIADSEEVGNEYTKRNMALENKFASNINIENSPKKHKKKGAEISNIRLVDEQNKVINNFITGNNIKIAIDYQAWGSIDEINIGIGLHSETDGYAFGYNTQMDEFNISPTNGTIFLKLDSLQLLSGSYFINAVCFEQSESIPFDFKPHVLFFKVYSVGVAQRYRGLVNFKHNWLVKSKEGEKHV